MPIAPRFPFCKYTCPLCRWSTTVVEKSDCVRGASCEQCKQTDSQNMISSKANVAEAALAHPLEFAAFLGRKI